MSWSANSDGSITWQGTVTITASSDPLSTGVAYLTLTPSNGVSNLPALVDGQPGLPPNIRNVNVTQVAYGTTPPASTATLVSPGGSGVASTYDLNLYVNSGQQGAAGTNATVLTAGDVVTTGILDGWVLVYSASAGKLVAAPPKRVIGPFISAITAYSGSANATLSTIGIPAQPWAWRPRVGAHFYATGTANTQVGALVRLNDPTAGDIVGIGLGLTGALNSIVSVHPHFGSSITGTSTYGQVAAGSAATLYLVGTQSASTTDSWAAQATNGQFVVEVIPS